MELLYTSLYQVLECPNLRLKKPSWLKQPSAMTVYGIFLVTYFLITGGGCHALDIIFFLCSNSA